MKFPNAGFRYFVYLVIDDDDDVQMFAALIKYTIHQQQLVILPQWPKSSVFSISEKNFKYAAA